MIDSHHHLWKYSAEQYDWIPPSSPLAQDHLLTELENATSSAGVDATVVVQARQVLEESDWLLSLADQTERIAGVVGWVPLIDEDVAEPLARLAAHPKSKAVRHVLQGEPDEYFLRDDFHRCLALLPDLDLRYDLLLFQRQLPVAIQLVDRQPNLGIIIDHIAKPEIRCSFWSLVPRMIVGMSPTQGAIPVSMRLPPGHDHLRIPVSSGFVQIIPGKSLVIQWRKNRCKTCCRVSAEMHDWGLNPQGYSSAQTTPAALRVDKSSLDPSLLKSNIIIL